MFWIFVIVVTLIITGLYEDLFNVLAKLMGRPTVIPRCPVCRGPIEHGRCNSEDCWNA